MQPALAPQKPLPQGADDNTLDIEAVWESAYEQVVRPDQVIVLNAYFLRHLRQLGPELGWMYIAFRQAAYSAGARGGQRTARFTGKAIAALSGSTERTFWNRAARSETWQKLAGLVNQVDEKPLWDDSSATPKRLPRKYSVAMTLPLTAQDASALKRWLAENAPESPEELPAFLNSANKVPVDKLLVTPGEACPPKTVHRLVREMFTGTMPDKELNALAELLHQHIQPPNDVLVLKRFFVEHILPQLGTGPGWMLAILRDRCWVDKQNGRTRSQVTVAGGYTEIAGWLGLSRPMTIYEWLREPVLQIYLHDRRAAETSGVGDTNKWTTPRVFDVLLEEIPSEIVQLALQEKDPVTHFSVSSTADFSIGVTRFSVSGYADFSMAVTQISQFSYAICRVFKLLSSFKLLKQITPPENPGANLGADAPVCDLENPEQKPNPPGNQTPPEPENPAPRIQAFPEDVRKTAELFAAAFNLVPPVRPQKNEKGGDFALWIKGLRELNSVAADYGVSIERAMQLTHAYWNDHSFTVARPQAVKSTMQSVLSRQKASKAKAAPAPTQTGPSYDPAQRRKEISAALGFDIDQPLTPEQQATLQTYLDGLVSRLPKNPLKS